jgi:plasmid stability protein
MAQILVRNLDEAVVKRLKARAKRRKRSLQAEVKNIIEQAAETPTLDMDAARELCREIRGRLRGRKLRDSTTIIRKGRKR